MGATKRSIKGNNGRARQSRLLKRIGLVLGVCLGVIIVVELSGGSGRRRRRRGPRNLNSELFKLRRRAHDAVQQQQQEQDAEDEEEESQILTKDQKIDLVLSASVHLVGIEPVRHQIEGSNGPGSYSGITGEFCKLNWAAHKESPSSTPMFRDLVGKSPDCKSNSFHLDLNEIVAASKRHDEDVKADSTLADGTIDGIDASLLAVPRAIQPTGVVFHESRCGSTLVANSLAAFDPTSNRVYSESAPPIAALRICGDTYSRCSRATAAALLRDVMHMMGRTDDPNERNLFFKIQSVGTRFIDVFTEAFPHTPYMFVYRDPVQVMMSHLDHAHMEQSNCVRPRKDPPKIVVDLVERHGKSVTELSHEEYCAAHLASICDSALGEMKRPGDGGSDGNSMGWPVNYQDLPDKLYEVIPHHFGVPLGETERDRIAQISGMYSKGRGNKAHEWKDDSERKEERATDAIRGACKIFLDETFAELEGRAAAAAAADGRGGAIGGKEGFAGEET